MVEKNAALSLDVTALNHSNTPPDTCSQTIKLKNTKDKENGYGREIQNEGITLNPLCCEDKLLSGNLGYLEKTINELPENLKAPFP